VQLGGAQPLAGPVVADQRALGEGLLATLQARRIALESEAAALEPALLALQGQLAQAQVQESELTRARDLAEHTYEALASKIEDARIAVRESANVVQVASRAAVPAEPDGLGPLGLAVIGGALGLLVAAAGVLAWDYWRREPQPAAAQVG
jgi:uncharacterized protein involved in exopolysaccharide biosynthesis